MSKQELVYVAEQEVSIGRPLPWPLFLRSGELLAPAGFVCTDGESLNRLLQIRPMRAARAGEKGVELLHSRDDDDLAGMPGPSTDPLQSLKHNAEGMVLTFQFPGDFEPRTAHVEFYGRVPMQSLIVSAPPVRAANGQGWQAFEGLPISAQVIFGRRICAFKTSVLRFAALPSGHLFLRYPTEAVSKAFRKALRIEVKLPVSIALESGAVTGVITNLSSGGCALSTGFVLGNSGMPLKLAFRFKVGASTHTVQLGGTIQSIRSKLSQQMRYGISFDPGMDHEVELALKSFVYEHLAER